MLSSVFRSSRSALRRNTRALSVSLEGYGQHLFKGAVAAPYLEKHGLTKNTLDSPSWTTNGNADKVLILIRCKRNILPSMFCNFILGCCCSFGLGKR